MTCSRRDALYTIGLAAAATALHGCGSSGGDDAGAPEGVAAMCGSDLCFKISDNPELQAVGGIVVLTQAPGKKIFVQRTGDATFSALSARCTHAGCDVGFTGEKFSCPCHGSAFATTGAVMNGPAVRPLDDFATVIAGDDVTITL